MGEQLIHDVYYALRNGPAWNQTLLVITYDEHGGCYDHVPPPIGAVPPEHPLALGLHGREVDTRDVAELANLLLLQWLPLQEDAQW